MVLKIENLTRIFDGKAAVESVSFEVNETDLVSIIGPSGAGKTTLLKMIAGLEKPDSGTVEKRQESPAILVFQDYILFPMMTVFENVAFGLRARHENKPLIRKKVKEIMGHFGLGDKLLSYPAELSAGQKQRTAIARAMVLNPAILLLDEPFANLDPNLKTETADFIRKTQKEYKMTILLVTHDLQEAFTISDKIGIMIDGRLCQFDSTETVYRKPNSLEVAGFLGHVNIVPERLFGDFGIDESRISKDGRFYARAEFFSIEKDTGGNGTVEDVRFAGHYIIYRVSVEDWICTVYRVHDDIRIGDRVTLNLIDTHPPSPSLPR